LRSLSLGVALYLDDGVIFEPSRESCFNTTLSSDSISNERVSALQMRNASGHLAKSRTDFNIDLQGSRISISRDRLERAQNILKLMLRGSRPSLHEGLRWSGTLASLHLVTLLQIFVKLERLQEKLQLRNRRRCLSAQSEENLTTKLIFWKPRLTKNLFISLLPSAVPCFNYLLYVDASSLSVGAILKDARELTIASSFRELPITLKDESSTAREQCAMKFGLEAFSTELSSPIILFTDSQAASSIFEKGSLSVKLHKSSGYPLHIQAKLRLNVKWIPRGLNQEADEASRLIDHDDWRINNRTFESLACRWEYPEADLFANDRNTKSNTVPERPGSMLSLYKKNGTQVDFVPLIAKVLRWCAFFKSVSIMGCPLWTSQSYFPILKDNDRNWAYFVKDGILPPTGFKIFDESGQTGAF
uniref:RNase H domain-containing protein n=1 Tax=Heligmosomoides polygyrus TaxID=6339 RepID=A0A183GCE4_HELPZ